jgi:hypothetical protein
MTTVQLASALQREMSYIVTDETMMERALKSLRKIRRERKAETEKASEPQEDSEEQVMQSLHEAFRELKLIKEGKEVGRPIEELLDEL